MSTASSPLAPPATGTYFPAFRHRNFRYYAVGQVASLGGTWMQNVALAWLVLDRTDSGTWVGAITAALFAPSLFLGAWSGSVADRYDVRRTVLVLQVALGAQAVVLAVLVAVGAEAMWSLLGLAIWNGIGSTFDRPIRQTLMNELVGDDELPSAIATNSALVQIGLVVGPAIGALLINTAGIAWCFAANAATYVVMFAAIAAIRPSQLVIRPRPEHDDGSVRAGLRYVRSEPELVRMMIAIGVASLLAYRVDVLLPLVAKDLGHGSGLFAALTAVRGCGALAAALFLASRFGRPSSRMFQIAGLVLSASLAALAVPVTWVALAAAFPIGVGMMMSLVCTLSRAQLGASAAFRGRIVALWFVVLSAGVVAGSIFVGALADLIGPGRTSLVAGASMLPLAMLVGRVPEA